MKPALVIPVPVTRSTSAPDCAAGTADPADPAGPAATEPHAWIGITTS